MPPCGRADVFHLCLVSLSPENELHEGGDWHLACGAGAQSTFVKRTEPPVTNTKPSPGLPAHSTLTALLRGSFIPNWGSPKHPQIPVPLPQLEHVHTLSVKCLAKSCPPYRRVNTASSTVFTYPKGHKCYLPLPSNSMSLRHCTCSHPVTSTKSAS